MRSAPQSNICRAVARCTERSRAQRGRTTLAKSAFQIRSWIWPILAIPTLPYAFLTRGLWSFRGCPPESLAYPGHPAPTPPLSYGIFLITIVWAWFAVWCAASIAIHRRLEARSRRWLRALSWAVPITVSLLTPVAPIFFVALATLC